jgi:transcriptional/translational regulatory protein YebC/TACO1
MHCIRSQLPLGNNITARSSSVLFTNQVRLAGHAKWQNIARTKLATDQAKAKMISRYVLLVRRAIVSNNMQADPKLNSRLAEVLAEAGKMNVPKATLERAIARAVNVKIISCNLEIQGPAGSAIVARCETDSAPNLRRDVKKILKKHDAHLMPEDSIITMFKSKGFVRAATKTKDGREIDHEFAEEAAIMSNAEEFELETYDASTDESLSKAWVFHTDAGTLNQCRGDLERLGLNILSSDLDLVPYRAIDFGEDGFKKILDLTSALSEHEQVIDVFHNALVPKEET